MTTRRDQMTNDDMIHTGESLMYTFDFLAPSESASYEPMTFPSYRPLVRSIDHDPSVVALGASLHDRPIGLVLTQIQPDGRSAIVLSLYVVPAYRRQGIATALLTRAESALAERGCVGARVEYVTGKPSTPALERLLQKCGWAPPQTQALTAKLSADALRTAPWVSRDRLPPDFNTFLWRELTDRDRQSIARRQEAESWIPSELIPFRHDQDFEPQTSLGLRYQGQVVGWMINHTLDTSTLRMTCVWVRRDLQRVGRCIPLLALAVESGKRGVDAGFEYVIWMAYLHQQGMAAFTRRWVAPYAVSYYESRSAEKQLGGKSANEVAQTEAGETSLVDLM